MAKRKPPAGMKPRKAKPALAIDLVDGQILVAILNPARFVSRVMWLMQDIKAGEILISQAALEAIQAAQYRPGIVPMDIGSVDHALGLASWKFSAQYLSVQPGAAQWFEPPIISPVEWETVA